jgi:prepilin-type N-terminal cleavage/methylation domain-containing protein
MARRTGFTLIEVLIAMAIVLVMAGVVYPVFADFNDSARDAIMATTVRQIRERVIYHTAVADCPMSAEGYPDEVEAIWFPGGRMPVDVWTSRPLNVQTVHGGKDATQPNNLAFIIKKDGTAAGHTAWYNASNGSFCVMVPRLETDEEIQTLFEQINGVKVGG